MKPLTMSEERWETLVKQAEHDARLLDVHRALSGEGGSVERFVLAFVEADALRARLVAVEKECDETLASVAAIKSFRFEDGKIDAALAGDAVLLFAATMADWFRGAGATNFVTATLKDPRDGAAYDITMQRIGAKPVAQVQSELTQRAEAAESRLAAVESVARAAVAWRGKLAKEADIRLIEAVDALPDSLRAELAKEA